MNYLVTFEMTHLACGDYDTLCERICECGKQYNLQYDNNCPDCSKEWREHSKPIDDDTFQFMSDCGSLDEHLERNSCPKKQGVVGDCHYELYAQQDIIVSAESEEEAENIADERCTLNKLIDEYLEKHNVIDFNSKDFDCDCIGTSETELPESVGDLRIVHEKMYYDNEQI